MPSRRSSDSSKASGSRSSRPMTPMTRRRRGSGRRATTRSTPPIVIAPSASAPRRDPRRSGRRSRMTIEVRPGPSGEGLGRSRSPSSMSYGNVIELGRVVVHGDEHRLRRRRSSRTRSPTSSMIASNSSWLRERQADLVDQRQLGVALAGLLDRPGAASAPTPMCWPTNARSVDVVGRRSARSASYVWTATTPIVSALGAERSAEPVARRSAPTASISPRRSRSCQRSRVDQDRLARCAGRRPSRPPASPTPNGSHARRIGDVGVDGVDVVREVDRAALARRTGRCRSSARPSARRRSPWTVA